MAGRLQPMPKTRERPFRCACCDDSRGGPRLMNRRGTREELVKELQEMAEGWDHLCKPELSEAATNAVAGLEGGSFSVKVGHTIYSVDETGDADHTGA